MAKLTFMDSIKLQLNATQPAVDQPNQVQQQLVTAAEPEPPIQQETPTAVSTTAVVPVESAAQVLDKIAAIDIDNLPAPAVDGATAFKMELDQLDSLLFRDIPDQINPVNYDGVRNTVKRIMADLKANPAYDQLMIDRDVHNIIAFIRATRRSAVDTNLVRAAKAEVKASSKSRRNVTFNIADDDSFAGAKPAARKLTADDIAGMEF